MNELLRRARSAMPGGVSSPVRAFGAVGGEPPFVARASGSRVWDHEGREYVDLVGSWGPMIVGHAHPAVVEAVARAAADGLSFGATCVAEVELAERVLRRFPFAGRVRFVSSGTEAVMSAVRLARGATGRPRVVKFENCYHGHSDGLLVKAGSGLLTFGTPSSAGVPPEIAGLTDVLPLGDAAAAARLFEERGDEIAAVLIEPLPANAGLLVQSDEFLRGLRELCTRHGALLIFDEVISGFRVAPGGMTELSGITPDLVTVGKILGGGLPVGAYLGPAELMEKLAPTGDVYQAGTLSGNPVGMAAGIATLDLLDAPGTYERLESLGAGLAAMWEVALDGRGTVARVGSILWLRPEAGAEAYGRLHPRLMERGVWMAPSAFEVSFVSTAHDDGDLAAAADALAAALDE